MVLLFYAMLSTVSGCSSTFLSLVGVYRILSPVLYYGILTILLCIYKEGFYPYPTLYRSLYDVAMYLLIGDTL